MAAAEGFLIKIGGNYLYDKDGPPGRKGHRYRVLAFIKDVPSYQEKVLVRAMTGPDTGVLFSCTPGNFMMRYVPEPAEPPPPAAEPVAAAPQEAAEVPVKKGGFFKQGLDV